MGGRNSVLRGAVHGTAGVPGARFSPLRNEPKITSSRMRRTGPRRSGLSDPRRVRQRFAQSKLCGVQPETLEKIQKYIPTRADFILNPPKDSKRGDAGILAWEAYANLLAAEVFDAEKHRRTARELLTRVNA